MPAATFANILLANDAFEKPPVKRRVAEVAEKRRVKPTSYHAQFSEPLSDRKSLRLFAFSVPLR
jgi:hypothetical protein